MVTEWGVFFIEGACSNQCVKCVVYTSDLNIGREKLLEIENEKNSNGIETVHKRFGQYENKIDFEDGEEWIIAPSNECSRGFRWRKAWVDAKNTSIAALHQIILPCGSLYQWEKEKYFNW